MISLTVHLRSGQSITRRVAHSLSEIENFGLEFTVHFSLLFSLLLLLLLHHYLVLVYSLALCNKSVSSLSELVFLLFNQLLDLPCLCTRFDEKLLIAVCMLCDQVNLSRNFLNRITVETFRWVEISHKRWYNNLSDQLQQTIDDGPLFKCVVPVKY